MTCLHEDDNKDGAENESGLDDEMEPASKKAKMATEDNSDSALLENLKKQYDISEPEGPAINDSFVQVVNGLLKDKPEGRAVARAEILGGPR